MKAKKIVCMGIAAVMMFSMIGCGKSSDNTSKTEETKEVSTLETNMDAPSTGKSDETLNIAFSSEPSTLWGAAVGKLETEECLINKACLDTLVIIDEKTNTVEPNLAKEWEWLDDTHCRFILRDDVTMSDGTSFVAEDVVYMVNVWKEVDIANDTGAVVANAVAEDEHTVVLEFTSAVPDFINMLGWSNFGIVSEDEVNAAGGLEAAASEPAVGSGRYKFVEWKKGQYITLERNDDYWNKDYQGYYKNIKISFIADAASREMAVESDDVQVAVDIPIALAAQYASNDKINTYVYDVNQVVHLWYNMGENAQATADPLVRKAIDKALDFDAITKVATAGMGQQALSYIAPGISYYSEGTSLEERAVDIEGAKELLKEAGYENGLELTILGLSKDEAVYTVMQANLAEAGITLNVNTPDVAQFVQGAFGGDYDLICVGDFQTIRTASTVAPFLQKHNVSGGGMVIGGPKWTNDEIDALITEIIQAKNTDDLTEKSHQFDELLKKDMICSNLYTEKLSVITAKDVKGVSTNIRGIDLTTMYK